jgi:ligand-binding SRPBCC domain-containing protein
MPAERARLDEPRGSGRKSFSIEVSSRLGASVDEVWDHASTMEGVNRELGPWVRMSVPRAARGLRLSDVEPGREAFVSVLFMLGVLPFDAHHLRLEAVLERGFDEESWSWLQRRWRHERRVEPDGDGCVVTDRLVVEPRWAPRALVEPIVRRLFEARHAYLRRRFDGANERSTE